MPKKENFFFPSADGKTKIHAMKHVPDGQACCILQIAHGMVEFIDRYDDFARFLAEKGVLVCGNDHLGHGASVAGEEDFGFFAEPNGNAALLSDLHQLSRIVKKENPGLPLFLLGHSMGSFYARQYLFQFGKELSGAIIMGTGMPAKPAVHLGKTLSKWMAAQKGSRYRSAFLDGLAFGRYNKRFTPGRTEKDWLSRDEAMVDQYLADPRCNFRFTLNAYGAMFSGIARLYKKKNLAQMPKDLPVLFLSGAEDPVGDFGKGVLRAKKSFEKAGMKHVAFKLYPNDRHEILNELDRATVYQDILQFLQKNCSPIS